MKYCPGCGNEVQEGAKFCPSCGTNLAQPAESRPSEQPGFQILLHLTGPQLWALLVLFIGGLLGFIGLWVDWTGDDANVVDYLREGFGDSNLPWWTGVIALGAIIGVVVTLLNIVSTLRNRALPSNGQLCFGGVLMGLCPLFTHIGFVAWLVVEFHGSGGDFWDTLWSGESPGLWIALTGGVLAVWANWIGARISSFKI